MCVLEDRFEEELDCMQLLAHYRVFMYSWCLWLYPSKWDAIEMSHTFMYWYGRDTNQKCNLHEVSFNIKVYYKAEFYIWSMMYESSGLTTYWPLKFNFGLHLPFFDFMQRNDINKAICCFVLQVLVDQKVILIGRRGHLTVILICISLIRTYGEHFPYTYWPFVWLLWRSVYLVCLPIFWLG